MKKEITFRWIKRGLLITFLLVVISQLIRRIHLGIETTDESLYATLICRMVQGNIPFWDMWEMTQTSSILFVPIVWVFKTIVGGFEGIQLFLRYMYLFVTLVVSIPIYHLARRFMDKKESILICGFYIVYAPFALYSVSYNNIVDAFGILMSVMVTLSILKESKKMITLAGAFAAIMAFCYPTQVLTCVIMVIYIFVLCAIHYKNVKEGMKRAFLFACGGVATGVLLALLLVCMAGITKLQTSISIILNDPVYGSGKTMMDYIKGLLTSFLYLLKPYTYYPMWIFMAVAVAYKVLKRWRHAFQILLACYPFVALYIAFHLPFLDTHIPGNIMLAFSAVCPILLFLAEKNRKQMMMIFVYQCVPGYFLYFTIAVSSAGAHQQAVQSLIITSIGAMECYILLLREMDLKIFINKISRYTLLCASVLAVLLTYYSVVYRDEPVNELTEQVEVGPYKGLYTTMKQKDFMEKSYEQLQKMQEKGKSVCVLYHANSVYLMLDEMIPCSPNAWGIYSGINNEQSFFDYFDKVRLPDYVFVVDLLHYEREIPEGAISFYPRVAPNLANYIQKAYSLEEVSEGDEHIFIAKYARK